MTFISRTHLSHTTRVWGLSLATLQAKNYSKNVPDANILFSLTHEQITQQPLVNLNPDKSPINSGQVASGSKRDSNCWN